MDKSDLNDAFKFVGDTVKEHPVLTTVATLGILYFLARAFEGFIPGAGTAKYASMGTAFAVAAGAAAYFGGPALKNAFDHVKKGKYKEAFSDLGDFLKMMNEDDKKKKVKGPAPSPAAT